MYLLFDKNLDDLNNEDNTILPNNGITATPGSIAKLFLSIVNNKLSTYYDVLRTNNLNAFLPTATGNALDSIGVLLSCSRYIDEEDDNYRDRLSKQILNTAKANETSIRLAILSCVGVEDVYMNRYTYGSGSFSAFLITNQIQADDSLITTVTSAVDSVVGYGIKYEILNPNTIPIKIQIKLFFADNTNDSDKQSIRQNVKDQITSYFTSLNIGEPIIIDAIAKQIMLVDKRIVEYVCDQFLINNKLATYIDQNCNSNERFMLSSDTDAIIIN